MKTLSISGRDYQKMVIVAADRLNQNRKTINDLNVFPIPDGDTGDNMYMTIVSGCKAAAGNDSDNIGEISGIISKGMLLGARGNSGVILSRIFAGISKGLANKSEADLDTFKAAMQSGVDESYSSVANPVEGTILTVIRESVQKANSESSKSFEEYFNIFCKESEESLERTPELLDVLKNAGVVDSGAAGLVCIGKGMAEAINGAEASFIQAEDSPNAVHSVDLDSFTSDSVLEFGYCTEFLLRLQSAKVNLETFNESEIFDYLNSVGNSVVAFRDGSIIKVHVHTMTPGDILNTCQKWGEYLTIKIENMTLQHHENKMEEKLFKKPRKNCAVVTVASGNGIVKTLKETGADIVIEGGQTMNPSAEEFIKAFDEANADIIYVLPNNSNIILTARQAAELYKASRVIVIPTKTIGAGYVVLGSADWSLSSEEVMTAAMEAIESISVGMVSKSVRDTKESAEGDYLGFTSGNIISHSPARDEALIGLCESMGAADRDVILIFKGDDVPQSEAEQTSGEIQRKFPMAEVIINDGGQPVFDYIIILE